jgi:hypothetical protein
MEVVLGRRLRTIQKRGSQKTQGWATKTLSEWDQIRATDMKEWTGRGAGTGVPEPAIPKTRPTQRTPNLVPGSAHSFPNPFKSGHETKVPNSTSYVSRTAIRESARATTIASTECLEGAGGAVKRARKAAMSSAERTSSRALRCVVGKGGLKRIAVRMAGPIGAAIGFAMDFEELAGHVQAYRRGEISHRQMCIALSGSVGGIGGAAAGATVGAYIGTFGGPFAWITVPLGALVGGGLGYMGGSTAGTAAVSACYDWTDGKLQQKFNDWLCNTEVNALVSRARGN